MRITVTDDPSAQANKTYELILNYADDDKSNNANWAPVSFAPNPNGYSQVEVEDTTGGLRVFYADGSEVVIIKGVLDQNVNQGASNTTELIDIDDFPNNTVLDVVAYCTGIKTDGTASFSTRRRAIFRKDNAGALTMDVAAATETLESVGGTVVAFSLLVNSGSLSINLQTGAAVGTHRCTSWAEVKVVKIPAP